MNFFIPKANTHPDVAKEQHLVPRTYMRQWSYNSDDSIWVIDKKELNKGIQTKNINSINYVNGYHDIKAGDLFMPDEALKELYSFLLPLKIVYDGKTLKTLRDIHNAFFNYEDWEIYDNSGIKATKKEKNEIQRVLIQSRFTFIEEQWCYQYENKFFEFISKIERNLHCKLLLNPYKITADEYKELMKYLLIFDFRNNQGNSYINDIIDCLPMDIFDEIDIPPQDRIHFFNQNAGDELRYALRISAFYNFLKNKEGIIQSMTDSYLQNLGIVIYLTTKNHPFITSELASLMKIQPNGLKEHIFIATPTMLISAFKSHTYGHIVTTNARPSVVWKYNKYIAKMSKTIITYDKGLNFQRLLST